MRARSSVPPTQIQRVVVVRAILEIRLRVEVAVRARDISPRVASREEILLRTPVWGRAR